VKRRRLAAALIGAYWLFGCLAAPEPQLPKRGEATAWSSHFDRVDWISEFHPKRSGAFGLDNLSIENETGPFSRFLRAKYYKGGASPSASRRAGVKEGGGQFNGALEGGPVDHLFLRYYVRFPKDFDFKKGGKLPGFYGGTEVSGGRIPDGTNGFSTRFMWRTDGQGEVYVYMPSSPKFGTSLGRGSWTFARDKWQCIEQEFTLNTPARSDGVVRVWLDGEPVYTNESLLIRTVPSLQIEGIFFSTFFGGGDASWAPDTDTYADFAAFATGPKRIGCAETQPGRSKETSESWTPKILQGGADGPYLPDFSFAGYRWGEEPIPDLAPTVDVTSFGAVPDDGKDDTDAFKRALAAAAREKGRVVLGVPKGRFVVSDILFVERGDFVLRGAGSGPGGTVISMPRPLEEMPRPEAIRKVMAYNLANDKRQDGRIYSPFSWTGGIVWTRLPAPKAPEKLTEALSGRRGDHRLRVANGLRIRPGIEIRIDWYNRMGDDSPILRHVFGLEGRKFGDRLAKHPDESIVSEEVTVMSVDGSDVVLKEPLLHDVRPEWQVEVTSIARLANVGIEHLTVELPNVPYAGHHHEQGFNPFYLTDLSHSWMKDVRIVNADSGVLTDDSSHLTFDRLRVEGREGHYGIHLGSVHEALVRNFEIDAEERHSLSFNTQSHASVFSHGTIRRATLDQHRGANHQNLFDDIADVEDRAKSNLFEHGGADYWGPTHGAFNTFWNVRIDFVGRAGPSAAVPLGGVDDAGPARIVGLVANAPLDVRYAGAYVEGTGRRGISVPSLYDHQLGARLEAR
jgi:hypothetical protein